MILSWTILELVLSSLQRRACSKSTDHVSLTPQLLLFCILILDLSFTCLCSIAYFIKLFLRVP